MALVKYISGPFDTFYIGIASASSTPLTQILNVGTGGYRVGYEVPKEFVACVNAYRQSGSARLTMSMSFISDDPQAFYLAMGNWLTTTNQDDTPSGQQYSILLLDSINTNGSSLYIPLCESETKWDLGRLKNDQTSIAINFRWQDANVSDHLFYKRSNSLLKIQMGAKSPY